MESVLRLAVAADLRAIERVQTAASRAAITIGSLGDPNSVMLVALVDDIVVAWAKTHRYPHADGVAPAGHYLGGVTVDPAFRRRGIASALVEARLNWIAERATTAYYFANARNEASIALHHAFREIARAPSFHGVTFDDGLGILFATALPLGSSPESRLQ